MDILAQYGPDGKERRSLSSGCAWVCLTVSVLVVFAWDVVGALAETVGQMTRCDGLIDAERFGSLVSQQRELPKKQADGAVG